MWETARTWSLWWVNWWFDHPAMMIIVLALLVVIGLAIKDEEWHDG